MGVELGSGEKGAGATLSVYGADLADLADVRRSWSAGATHRYAIPPLVPTIDPMAAQRPAEAPERRSPIAVAPPRDAEVDDPLRVPRGILLGIAIALIGFWLPLSFAAWRFLR